MQEEMFVYLIESIRHPARIYIGVTKDVQERLKEHNSGKSPYTLKHKPWRLVSYTWFRDEGKAREFERYLKSGSGRAFAKRHFW